MEAAVVLADHEAAILPDNWMISEHYPLHFSKTGTRLHFGIAPEPLVEDTTLLEEEKVDVEVWHYRDDVLYTQQNVQAKSEKERSYHCIADLGSGKIRQVADEHLRESRMDADARGTYVVLTNDQPYRREASWTGERLRDVWIYDFSTGRHRQIAEAVEGTPGLSPDLQYVYWYHSPDSAWYAASVRGDAKDISKGLVVWDEEHDDPSHPSAYGMAGWLRGDQAVLLYDRFDIWKVDPTGDMLPENLTNGRAHHMRYRYIDLDREEQYIDPDKPLLLHVFDESTKASGYAHLDLRTGELKELVSGDLSYTRRVIKARDADVLVYTAESFQQFPDLQVTTDWFTGSTTISDVNPQQKEYRWGTIELYSWTAYDGKELQGLLVKPEGFDPQRQYPMIVNFYERSTDGLHTHRTPFPHRSTINYPFYASRGYVIFNPDVVYDIGYPGESAYNCVVSGTEAILREGFVDPQRVALQGHSWGGYQIAHLLTRTGIYKCAESGAPVVNMVSAYGGIRWETGLSRMFQYEHTQSRLGATLWEEPERYLDNSPVFNLDKISTPVLIMHNDHDGHVPWYQGIEFFIAMRRLGKPAWMLNYPGEPHWPVKLQNRKDFNIRLQQFFDHYLMDAPMPRWMRDGLPAVEKGIKQGYELIKKED
jgi:dipeptidyl aminopeptidase/acylaminoacyl peptidase